jgi:hypothetical protein
LVAGGALFGVIVAILTVFFESAMTSIDLGDSMQGALGELGYFLLGVAFFAFMAFVLYRVASRRSDLLTSNTEK